MTSKKCTVLDAALTCTYHAITPEARNLLLSFVDPELTGLSRRLSSVKPWLLPPGGRA
jgi:hypothetical protein